MTNVLLVCLVAAGLALLNLGVWAFLVNRLVKMERALIAIIHSMVDGTPEGEIPEDLAVLLATPSGGAHRG